jgi:hypothetical protein
MAEAGPSSTEVEQVLRWVERNMVSLTLGVPMEDIEDLFSSMQTHIVGVPRAWVHIFSV